MNRLILLMWSWVESGAGAAAAGGASAGEAEDAEEPDEAEFETRRVLHELTALHATRYYFALIKIIPSQVSIATRDMSRPGVPRSVVPSVATGTAINCYTYRER